MCDSKNNTYLVILLWYLLFILGVLQLTFWLLQIIYDAQAQLCSEMSFAGNDTNFTKFDYFSNCLKKSVNRIAEVLWNY